MTEEFVTLDIRNQQAHRELQSFNDTGKFLFIHSIAISRQFAYSQLNDLTKLKKENPDAFINEITNITQNIRRIQSNIRNKKYKSKAEKESWEDNLKKALLRKEIITQILTKND